MLEYSSYGIQTRHNTKTNTIYTTPSNVYCIHAYTSYKHHIHTHSYLAAELPIGHIELAKHVAGREGHQGQVQRVPGG